MSKFISFTYRERNSLGTLMDVPKSYVYSTKAIRIDSIKEIIKDTEVVIVRCYPDPHLDVSRIRPYAEYHVTGKDYATILEEINSNDKN